MGKASVKYATHIFHFLVSLLDSYIITPLSLVSQTAVFKLNVVHFNLHKFVDIIPNTMFEAELFPSLVINHFKPLHVNVFATGKVVVLGKDALRRIPEIETYLNAYCK